MRPVLTRVLRVTFEGDPHLTKPWLRERTRITAVVLYPLEVKRRLRTLEHAQACAVKIARGLIRRRLFRPPVLNVLRCTAEVIEFDPASAGLFRDSAWAFRDGTKAWLIEVERAPHCPSWPTPRKDEGSY